MSGWRFLAAGAGIFLAVAGIVHAVARYLDRRWLGSRHDATRNR
jgi:hypothetical protein